MICGHHGLSTILFDHGHSAAFGFKPVLNCSAVSANKLLLNSSPLSGITTPGPPNIAI